MTANANPKQKPFVRGEIVYTREYDDYCVPFRVEDIWFSDGWYCSITSMQTRKLYESIEAKRFVTKRVYFSRKVTA